MTLRDDLIPVLDEVRGEIEALGLRVRAPVAVVSVTSTDDGTTLRPTSTTSTLTLTPAPRVRDVPLYVGGESGKVQSGDLVVDRISATYTREQLDPPGDGHWLLDGQPYRVVSAEERFLGWVVRLRRMTRNA